MTSEGSNSVYVFAPLKLTRQNPIPLESSKMPLEDGHRFHLHDCLEFGYCRKGQGVFIVEDKVMPYREGDVCFLNQFEFHCARSTGDEASEWDFFYIDPFSMLLGFPEHDHYMNGAALGGGGFRNIRSGEQFPALRHAMELFIAELKARKDGWLYGCYSILRYIMIMLYRDRENRGNTENELSLHRPDIHRLAPALKKISSDYAGGITVRELAKLCGMSQCTFYRTFCRVFLKSPQNYLINYRIQMGAFLIRHKNMGVVEAARSVGYECTSSFHHHFRSIFGKSPRDYRLGKD